MYGIWLYTSSICLNICSLSIDIFLCKSEALGHILEKLIQTIQVRSSKIKKMLLSIFTLFCSYLASFEKKASIFCLCTRKIAKYASKIPLGSFKSYRNFYCENEILRFFNSELQYRFIPLTGLRSLKRGQDFIARKDWK